eukprot:g40131.t1
MDVGGESVSRDGDGEVQEQERGVRNSPGEFEGRVEGAGEVDELLVFLVEARGHTEIVIDIAEKEVRDGVGVVVEEGLFHKSYIEAGIAQARAEAEAVEKEFDIMACVEFVCGYRRTVLSAKAALDEKIQRLQCAGAAFNHLRKRVFEDNNIRSNTKIMVYRAVVVPAILYGSE